MSIAIPIIYTHRAVKNNIGNKRIKKRFDIYSFIPLKSNLKFALIYISNICPQI